MIISEIEGNELESFEKKTEKLIEGFRPSYKKFFKRLQKEHPQVRVFSTEILIQSILNDSQSPPYVLIGMLERLKTWIQNSYFNDNFLGKNLRQTIDSTERRRSYIE